MSRHSGRTMREERRTYRRHRCGYREPTGAQCRSRPTAGSAYCMLHEPTPVRIDRCMAELDSAEVRSGHHPTMEQPMAARQGPYPLKDRTPALCGHWEPDQRKHCDDKLTRRFINGWRCVLHAPGADETACPHRIPWTEPCGPCAAIWGGQAEQGGSP